MNREGGEELREIRRILSLAAALAVLQCAGVSALGDGLQAEDPAAAYAGGLDGYLQDTAYVWSFLDISALENWILDPDNASYVKALMSPDGQEELKDLIARIDTEEDMDIKTRIGTYLRMLDTEGVLESLIPEMAFLPGGASALTVPSDEESMLVPITGWFTEHPEYLGKLLEALEGNGIGVGGAKGGRDTVLPASSAGYSYTGQDGSDVIVKEVMDSVGTEKSLYATSAQFITGCAARCGLISEGEFCETLRPDELFASFVYSGRGQWSYLKPMFRKTVYTYGEGDGQMSSSEEDTDMSLYKGDLIFFESGDDAAYLDWERRNSGDGADENGPPAFTGSGIIVEAGMRYVIYATTDSDGNPVLRTVNPGDCPETAILVDIHYDGTEEVIKRYLRMYLPYSDAVLAGILANIYCESGYDAEAVGDEGTSYGLCQWHNERWTALESFCRDNSWGTDGIKAQILFLRYEMDTDFQWLGDYLQSLENSSAGAKEAGYAFCLMFESPTDAETKAEYRGRLAGNTFWDIMAEA